MANRCLQGPVAKAKKEDPCQRSQKTGKLGFKIPIKYFIYKYQSVEVVKTAKFQQELCSYFRINRSIHGKSDFFKLK
jgi:hypothetical protein